MTMSKEQAARILRNDEHFAFDLVEQARQANPEVAAEIDREVDAYVRAAEARIAARRQNPPEPSS